MIGLSLLPTAHPPSFQPRWVRPSTGSYPRFSLPMDSSPGFASAARDCSPCSDSLSLRLARGLTSPRAATRWLILQKARRHTGKARAPTACRQAVSGTVSLPSRGAFHLSLTVLVRYRSHGSTQAWMVVHPGSDRVSRARPYSGTASRGRSQVRVRGSNPLRPAFPCRSAPWSRSPGPGRQSRGVRPYNPGGANAAARMRSPVWPYVPFRSPLLGESRD